MVARIQSVLAVTLIALICSSCAGTHTSANSAASNYDQVLYLLDGSAISTYAIDRQTFTFVPVGQSIQIPALKSLIQLVASPNGRFLYLLWADSNAQRHMSVYATDSVGVPQVPALQVLSEPYLFQLNFHPSGRFAYALEVRSSNGHYGPSSSAEYTASIRLFHVDNATGIVKKAHGTLGVYGPSFYWPVSLYGVNSDGSKLFLDYNGSPGSAFRVRSINALNGALGSENNLFGQTGSWESQNTVTIGNKLLVDQYHQAEIGFLDIFANPPGAKPLIHCTNAMFAECTDASGAQLDPSGKYLFFTDALTLQVRIAHVALNHHNILGTGNAIPPLANTSDYFFSPDGTLIYATLASDASLHVFGFNPETGVVSGGETGLVLPVRNSALLPVTRN